MPWTLIGASRQTVGPEDFSWVHNVVGVDRFLDRTHNAHWIAVLGNQKVYLAATDTVLAGAGAFERQRPMDHSLVEPFSLAISIGVIRIEHEANVEVTVAGMANDRCR